MKRKAILLLIAVGLFAGSLAVWWSSPYLFVKDIEDLAFSMPALRPIPTAVVSPLSGVRVRQFPGTVRATRRVELAFSVPGLLKELYAQEGAQLRKGEVLARLDQRDYRHALDAAIARYADSRQQFRRLTRLRQQHVAAEAEYDRAKSTHGVAEAELHIRKKALEDTVLLAPFDGLVAKRYVENYEHIAAKQPVLSFQNISIVEVVIQVPERLIARGVAASLGSLQVRFDADAERWFEAEVREFSVQSNPVTRTYDVVVGVTPPSDIEILPGMTATVTARSSNSAVKFDAEVPHVLVPVEAVILDDDGASCVWIIDHRGGAARKQFVDVGVLREEGIEVFSGLQPGQHVAIAGLHTLQEGMRVRPMVEKGEGLDG